MSDVLTYFKDVLQKENDFLETVYEFLPELQAYLHEQGQSEDELFLMLQESYEEAKAQAGKLYAALGSIINGLEHRLAPAIEATLPPIKHESRQSALYLLGCHACIRMSPERFFFDTLTKKQAQYIDCVMQCLQAGEITSEEVWGETQAVLQLDATIPRERKDPRIEQAKKRKQTLVVPMAFAAGKWLGDDGIDFIKDIVAESGLM